MEGSSDLDQALGRDPDEWDPVEIRAALGEVQARLFESAPAPLKLGRYVLIQRLGGGGGGVVYRAHDSELRRPVAIKVLPDRGAAELRERRIAEARAVAAVTHPNIVAVYDVGRYDIDDACGQLGAGVFVVMELAEGRDLAEWVRNARPAPKEILRAYVSAGRGLAAAHRAGVVHGDFKPANVCIDEGGRVCVLDFGLARVAREGGGPGDELPMAGTPAYMAPEQHRGEDVDARADQFAFCAALWEALYGVRPFSAVDPRELLFAKEQGPGQAPQASVPAGIEPALRRGLAPDPEARWSDMDSLLERLEPTRRRRWWAWAVGVVISLAALFLLVPDRGRLVVPACEQERPTAAELWPASTQEQVRSSFDGARAPPGVTRAVMDAMTGYMNAWTRTREKLCESPPVGAAEVAHKQDALDCLASQLDTFGVLAGVLKTADSSLVAHAPRAVRELPDPMACEEAHDGPRQSDSPGARARGTALARARMQAAAGLYEVAESTAREALAEAQRVGDTRTEAMAAMQIANLVWNRGYADTVALNRSAVLAAERLGDPALVVEALVDLAEALGPRDDGTEFLLDLAEVRAHEIADERQHGRMRARILSTRGRVSLQDGDFQAASQTLALALEKVREAFGDDHPRTVAAMDVLSVALAGEGRLDEAIDLNNRHRHLIESVHGPAHPMVAHAVHLRGLFEALAGYLDSANVHLGRAIELERAVEGDDALWLVEICTARSWVLESLGRPDEAADMVALARRVAGRLDPTDPRRVLADLAPYVDDGAFPLDLRRRSVGEGTVHLLAVLLTRPPQPVAARAKP